MKLLQIKLQKLKEKFALKEDATDEPYKLPDKVQAGSIHGATRTEIDITFNYVETYKSVGFSMRDLDCKTGKEVEPILLNTMQKLKEMYETEGEPDHNYWAATPGNAYHYLEFLYNWSKRFPNGIFVVNW